MPQSVSMKLTVEDTTTAKDLLLNLAHKPRMRSAVIDMKNT